MLKFRKVKNQLPAESLTRWLPDWMNFNTQGRKLKKTVSHTHFGTTNKFSPKVYIQQHRKVCTQVKLDCSWWFQRLSELKVFDSHTRLHLQCNFTFSDWGKKSSFVYVFQGWHYSNPVLELLMLIRFTLLTIWALLLCFPKDRLGSLYSLGSWFWAVQHIPRTSSIVTEQHNHHYHPEPISVI